MTTIRYFIPEDGDSESYPNVFLAPKPRQPGYPPSLGEVKGAFPLPGRYHFRFKSPLVPGSDRDKGSMAVWLDCIDDRQPVPTWKSSIVAKVTRIGVDDDDDDDDDEFARPSAPVSRTPAPPAPPVVAPSTSRPHHTPTPSHNHGPSLDIFDGPSPSTMQSQHSMSAPPSTGSLLDGHTPVSVAATASSSSGVKDSLLDMSGPVYGGSGGGSGSGSGGPSHITSSSSSAAADFFGMTAPSPSNPLPPAPMSGGYQPQQQQSRPLPQQQQQQQQFGMASQAPRPGTNSSNNNAFNSFSQQSGPFGDLGTPWK